jgi:predicted nucleotidyltransferase component of viral defense system
MIPKKDIIKWREQFQWPTNDQVEQDLLISRVLVEIFNNKTVARHAVFRGGTALHKLFSGMGGRYSEDIDLVQRDAGPIGPLVNAIRDQIDPWLGTPKYKQTNGRFTFYYSFKTSIPPVSKMRLKIEINTREHFSIYEISTRKLIVENPWFSGSTDIPVYNIDELLGTKMRALYQRKKGRDLYDLWLALSLTDADCTRIVNCFELYMKHEKLFVSRAMYEKNMDKKVHDIGFLEDVNLVVINGTSYNPFEALKTIQQKLMERLSGAPWKSVPKPCNL